MHVTLSPRANRIGIACFASAAIILVFVTSGAVLSFCGAGATLGAVAGILQYRELCSRPGAFARAKTARDVRRTLARSWWGKVAIGLTWLCLVVLVVMTIKSEAEGLLLGAGYISGGLSFSVVRDLIAYPALSRVAAEAKDQLEAGKR